MKVLCVVLLLCPAVLGQMSFLMIGDWGGQSKSPYTTPSEVHNSVGMGKVAASLNSRLSLGLGDNFYEDGIWGSQYAARFKETFDDVFTAPSLQHPWYFIAGNHDYLGNVSAEIGYTQISKRWKFPSEYYSWTEYFMSNGKNVSAQFVLIDTVVLLGNGYYDEEREVSVAPPGPEDPVAAASQWDWIENELKTSKADYLFVGGHYPVYSVCVHGPTITLDLKLRPMLEKYKATAYLSGHDHCLEYLEHNNIPYVVSGAGHNCCYSDKHIHSVPKGSVKFYVSGSNNKNHIDGGFASVTMTDTGASAKIYDTNGTQIYETPVWKPRNV